MSIILDGTTGATLPVPLAVAQGGTGSTTLTLTSPVIAGTPSGVGVLTSGTAVASTSGTSIDFTGIPSWAKRITVMFNGVSTNGTSLIQIRLGNGSIVVSGYDCSYSTIGSGSAGGAYATSGFILNFIAQAAQAYTGVMYITNLSANIWTETATTTIPSNGNCFSAGGISLGSTLDRVRITTVNGTDVFDAGSINILYE